MSSILHVKKKQRLISDALHHPLAAATKRVTVTQQEIAETLFRFHGTLESIGARGSNKKHVYICPQGCKCKSKGAKVMIKAKSSYTNLYRHLVSCAGKGDLDVVLEMFEIATKRTKLKQVLVLDSFSSSNVKSNDLTAVDSPPSKYDEELYEWLVLIILKNNSLSIVVHTHNIM